MTRTSPDLERFVSAQDEGGTYERALAELRAGRKTGHWMWFVFPQIEGLGRSAMSKAYAIGSLVQAQAYLADPVLGLRLQTCVEVLLELGTDDAEDIFGGIDAVKLRSSVTLFARAAPDQPRFAQVLDKFFAGRPDPETDRRLVAQGERLADL